MSKSNEYWQQRALKREDETFAKGAELTARLFKEYERAAREIRKQVNDFYARYATENGISFDEAVKNLNRSEKQEWKESLGRWVKRINEEQNEAIKAMLKAELDALSYNSQINRLEALYGQIQMILNELFSVGVQQMQEAFGDMFEEAYYKKVYDIQQRVGFINEFAKINESIIENIVSYPWSGADFSQRLWENKKVLHFHVRETITQGLIQGKSVPNMTKDLSDRMGSSFKNAERLIRTETTHFHNEATKTAYEAAGVKEYEYMATLDNRTSSVCKGLDGKHFKLSEAKAGTNFPPMHPWCRSTTVEYDPEDALDWYNSGYPMPENMTYKEWLEETEVTESLSDPIAGLLESESASTKAVKKKMTEQLDQLTDEEKKQITKYTGFAATRINLNIRLGKINKRTQKECDILDAALAKGTIVEDVKLYRWQSFSQLGLNAKKFDDKTIELIKGRVVNHDTYTSTSFSSFDMQGRDTYIHFKVPAGYKGALYIKELAVEKYKYQDEVLFARGLSYEITDASIKDGIYIIHAEVLMNE